MPDSPSPIHTLSSSPVCMRTLNPSYQTFRGCFHTLSIAAWLERFPARFGTKKVHESHDVLLQEALIADDLEDFFKKSILK